MSRISHRAIDTRLAAFHAPMFRTFPEDAHWNAERQAVEFWLEIGEYHGAVRVPRRVFQRLLPERPTPERCVEAYYLQRAKFASIAEPKPRRRQLTEDSIDGGVNWIQARRRFAGLGHGGRQGSV
jgi:hypothetical protein